MTGFHLPSYERVLLLPPCSVTPFYKCSLSQAQGRSRKRGLEKKKKPLLPQSHPYAKLFYEKIQGKKKETPTRRTSPGGAAPNKRQDGCEHRFSFVSLSSHSAPPTELAAGGWTDFGLSETGSRLWEQSSGSLSAAEPGAGKRTSKAAPSPGPYGDAAPSLKSCRRDGVLVLPRDETALLA